MMTKIKVLLLLHELSRTGAPKVALDLLDVLGGELEVRSITIQGGPLADRCAAHGHCKILAEDWSVPRWKRPIHRVRNRLWKRGLRRWSPDLIYVNSVAALPIATMVQLPDAPAILHVHELNTLLEMAMNEHPDLLTRWPSRYIAVSEAVAQALHTDFGIDRERIALIHAFILARDFERVQAASPPQPGVGFVVGGAGLPSWTKGTILWLQMVAEVRRLLGPSARFVWVGVPEWPAPEWFLGAIFRRKIELLGLNGVVELVPSNPKPLEHFARFDVFAMTSWEDSCPLVVLKLGRRRILSPTGPGGY